MAGVVAARLAGWCRRGVSETQQACLLTEPQSPPILASLEKGAHLQRFTCMIELGPNRIEDPAFAVPLLQGIHGHAGKVDGLLNLPGVRRMLSVTGEAWRGKPTWSETQQMWTALAQAQTCLSPWEKKMHTF